MSKACFVFGSNEAGIHGAGAAKTAWEKHGARMKFSYGHWGNSFAIPTKDQQLNTLQLKVIEMYVGGFLAYAHGHPELEFQVTRIGTGLAGLLDRDIAPMFQYATDNCQFDTAWRTFLPSYQRFWGTF
jgi:hypothetical protein